MFIKLSKEQNEQMINDIQTFFTQERDEELSYFAAEQVFQFIKEKMGPHFYNAALKDAKVVVEQRMLSIEEDLSVLERPVKR